MRSSVVALVFLVATLAGCASTQSDLTPAQRVYALQSELDAVLNEVETYAAQPECSEAVAVACHDPDVLAALVDAAGDADTALDEAEAVVRSAGGDREPVVYINAARAALGRISTLLVEGGR